MSRVTLLFSFANISRSVSYYLCDCEKKMAVTMFEFFIAINSYNLLASRAIMKNPEDENLVHLTRRFDYYVDLNF